MVFVDTSVWIEFFAGRDGPEVDILTAAWGGRVCPCSLTLFSIIDL